MSPRTRLGIGAGLAVLGLVVALLLRVDRPQLAAPLREVAETPLQQPRSSLSTERTLDAPEERRAVDADPRPHDADRTDQVSFHYADGQPAAGLALYRTDGTLETNETGIHEDVPHWTHHLGPAGELSAQAARELGSTLAVRLCEFAVEVLPFEPALESNYVLSSMVKQPIALDVELGEDSAAMTIWLQSIETQQFWNSSVLGDDTSPAPFADRYRLSAKHLSAPLLVAFAQVTLTGAQPVVQLRLPRGEYRLGTVTCPFGWWMDESRVRIDGAELRLSARRVPITHVILPLDAGGRVIAPKRVVVYSQEKPRPGFAESSGDVEARFILDGDGLAVAQRGGQALKSTRSSL
jgi:hypothetical protein